MKMDIDKNLIREVYNRLLMYEAQIDAIKNSVYELKNSIRGFRQDWLEPLTYDDSQENKNSNPSELGNSVEISDERKGCEDKTPDNFHNQIKQDWDKDKKKLPRIRYKLNKDLLFPKSKNEVK